MLNRSLYQIIISLTVICLTQMAASAGVPENLLSNPGFEEPFTPCPAIQGKAKITGLISTGWKDDSSWADVTVEYSREVSDVHGGKSAQRVLVGEIRSGGVQVVQPVPVLQGHVYSIDVWLKGQQGAVMFVAMRQAPSPYESFGQKDVILTGAWQHVTLHATPTSTTAAFVMISPPTGSALLIDDASAVDVTNATSSAPANDGNLLPDSSFEAGFGGGWSGRALFADTSLATTYEHTDPRPVIDTATAADQKQSVELTLPCRGRVVFSSPLVAFNYGRVHTASVWLKSNTAGATVALELKGVTDTKTYRLSQEWKRYAFTSSIPYTDGTRLRVIGTLPTAGTIWLDGAELVEASQPSTATPPVTETVLAVDRPGGVFFDDEPAEIHLSIANPPAGSTVHLSCLDLYGRVVTLPPLSASNRLIRMPADKATPRGMFKLTAQVYSAAGTPVAPAVEQVFARLPKPRNIEPTASYFGVHIPLAPQYFAIARAIGARWTRIHDASFVTKWPIVEPQRGGFTFTDEGVDAANKAGIAVLGMLDGGPLWATVKPNPRGGYFANYNHVDATNALDDWNVYVSKVVAHYKGKIDYWEVWNEPWGEFSPGSPVIYGNLLRTAYPAVKQANPDAVVVGMDTGRGVDAFTDTALKTAGGSESYDQFSYHVYYDYRAIFGGPKSAAAADGELWDTLESKYGHVTPRWVTESAPGGGVLSLYCHGGAELDTRIQYMQTIRFDVTLLGAGVKHAFYYTLHSDPQEGERSLCGLEHDRTIRPIMAARAVLASLIDGAKCLGRTEPVPGVDCYSFRHADGGKVDVVWCYQVGSQTIKLQRGSRALDALGNTISSRGSVSVSSEPLYIVR